MNFPSWSSGLSTVMSISFGTDTKTYIVLQPLLFSRNSTQYWGIGASTNKSQMFVTFIKVYSVITVCHNSASSILQHNDDCFSLALLRSYGHILYSRWKVSVRPEWLWTVCKSAKSFPSFLKLMINRWWWWVRYTTQGVKLGIDLTMSIKLSRCLVVVCR